MRALRVNMGKLGHRAVVGKVSLRVVRDFLVSRMCRRDPNALRARACCQDENFAMSEGSVVIRWGRASCGDFVREEAAIHCFCR